MPDDDRTTPEAAPPDDDGTVGTDLERTRIQADFRAKRAEYQAARAKEKQDRKQVALDELVHRTLSPRKETTPKRFEAEPTTTPKHLTAVAERVDAVGERTDAEHTARMAAAEAKEADDRRSQRDAADRSAKRTNPPPAEKTKETTRGSSRRRSTARRSRRASKKPTQPERTSEERNAAARKRAAADPVALLDYAATAGWTWLRSQLDRWASSYFDTGTRDENAAVFRAAEESQTPEWHVFEVRYLTILKQKGDYEKDGGRFEYSLAQSLVTHLAALPEAPGSESGPTLLAAFVERMPAPAEWDTRRHRNLPASLANTRHVVHRSPSADDQQHLPFDWDAAHSEPHPNEPRYVVPAWLPNLEPPPSKLISSPIGGLWTSGSSRSRRGPVFVPIRVGWELLLAPAPGDYMGGVADVSVKLGDLALPIWPITGRYKRTVHGRKLRDAARWLNNPDNATQWSADVHAPPTNLVLWYRAPTPPYDPDQVISAYVTAPDGGRRRGAQIDNHLRRILAAISYRQHLVYVNACILWDRYATVHGYLVQLTVPEVIRNNAGYILDSDGKVAIEKNGSASRRPTHALAVQTGKRLPNLAADNAFPWLEGEDSILVANPRVVETLRERNMQRGYTIETLIELRGANKHRGSVLDFEARYRGEGVLSSTELMDEKTLPPNSELEAVRLLPTPAHFAAYEARRKDAAKAKRAQRRRG